MFDPFGTTPYPTSGIAQLLQVAYAARERQRERKEQQDALARQKQMFDLQVSEQQRAQAAQQEQARVDAMPVGSLGVPVKPGFENRTVGELRRAFGPNWQQHVINDPQANARDTINSAQDLFKITGQPVQVPGSTVAAAFPGLPIPQRQGPFADVPGADPRGTVGNPSLPNPFEQAPGPSPVFQGGPAPLTIGQAPQQVTLGQLGGDAIRPEFRNLPWDPHRPIPDQYILRQPTPGAGTVPVTRGGQTYNVTPGQALADSRQPSEAQAAVARARANAQQALKDFYAANTPAEKQAAAQRYNAYLQEANQSLQSGYGVTLPGFAPLPPGLIAQASRETERRTRATGGGGTSAPAAKPGASPYATDRRGRPVDTRSRAVLTIGELRKRAESGDEDAASYLGIQPGGRDDKLTEQLRDAEEKQRLLAERMNADPMAKYDESLKRQLRNAEIAVQVLGNRLRRSQSSTQTPTGRSDPARPSGPAGRTAPRPTTEEARPEQQQVLSDQEARLPASAHTGQTATDPKTGFKYRSDGKRWVRVQ